MNQTGKRPYLPGADSLSLGWRGGPGPGSRWGLRGTKKGILILGYTVCIILTKEERLPQLILDLVGESGPRLSE